MYISWDLSKEYRFLQSQLERRITMYSQFWDRTQYHNGILYTLAYIYLWTYQRPLRVIKNLSHCHSIQIYDHNETSFILKIWSSAKLYICHLIAWCPCSSTSSVTNISIQTRISVTYQCQSFLPDWCHGLSTRFPNLQKDRSKQECLIDYIPRTMQTVLVCLVSLWWDTGRYYPYWSGLIHWYWTMPVTVPWRLFVNRSYEKTNKTT